MCNAPNLEEYSDTTCTYLKTYIAKYTAAHVVTSALYTPPKSIYQVKKSSKLSDFSTQHLSDHLEQALSLAPELINL